MLITALGVAIWLLPPARPLVLLSYDLLILLKPAQSVQDLVMVYLDERTFDAAGQSPAEFDRAHYARLLDYLKADGAALVVLDVWFGDKKSPQSDTLLAEAIRANGRVVLATLLERTRQPGLRTTSAKRPLPELLQVARGWGLAEVLEGQDEIVRRCHPGTDQYPSLPWEAARQAGSVPHLPYEERAQLWLNYYGPFGTFPSVSFCQVTNEPPGYFRGKFVFVGLRPAVRYAFDLSEECRTPYVLGGAGFSPRVDILATAFLNIFHQEGLRRLSWKWELPWIILAGLLAGLAAAAWRPTPVMLLALGGAAACLGLALLLFHTQRFWCDWTVVAFVQLPCALVGSFLLHRPAAAPAESESPWAADRLQIPDHTLLREVGRGAYGQVWLARNAIGTLDAVKIVRRSFFAQSEPYEREFRGIEKFMPISRSHPGFLNILHVGRNDQLGYFFYVMEAADDITSSQQIHPDAYQPKTLAAVLAQRRSLPEEECVRLAIAMAAALDHLHQHQLIHRDIKPANIIYVHDQPKFADIGLVTNIQATGRDVTCVGTLGYLAPEGPGTAAADLFSLGKVLYTAWAGLSAESFPELPSADTSQPESPSRQRLIQIIFKACHSDLNRRYQSAAALHADLLRLQHTDWDGDKTTRLI